jgi:hypothetical protein
VIGSIRFVETVIVIIASYRRMRPFIIAFSSPQHPSVCWIHEVDQPTGKTPQRHAAILIRRDLLGDPCLHAEVRGGTSKTYRGHA